MTILRSQRDLYDRFHQEAKAIDAAAGSPPPPFDYKHVLLLGIKSAFFTKALTRVLTFPLTVKYKAP